MSPFGLSNISMKTSTGFRPGWRIWSFWDAEFGRCEIVNIVLDSIFSEDGDRIGAVPKFAFVAYRPGLPVGSSASLSDFSNAAEFCSL